MFVAQSSEEMMRAGRYYSLFIIFVHVIKDFKRSGGLKKVLGPTKTFSSSKHDNSAIFNPGQWLVLINGLNLGCLCTCQRYKHSISFHSTYIHVSVDHMMEMCNFDVGTNIALGNTQRQQIKFHWVLGI